jgi:hypothetical protein
MLLDTERIHAAGVEVSLLDKVYWQTEYKKRTMKETA